jgi:hypothetical protein
MFFRTSGRRVVLLAVCAAAVTVMFSGSLFASDHFIKTPSLIPRILWCRGCTPTSASMVVGYWDNAGTGAKLGSGRLIDYWRDLSENADGSGRTRNAPNTLLELVKVFHTTSNGSTRLDYVSPGIRSVANSLNRYGFVSKFYIGSKGNDYCWNVIKSEITRSRPMVWSVGTSSGDGHSLCAWGYTDKKYVITYNTWNSGRDDWYYRRYDNGATTTWQYVSSVIPGKLQSGQQLFARALTSTSYKAGSHVTLSWQQYGTSITRAYIYYSADGGSRWYNITKSAMSRAGINRYVWTVPNRPSTRCRIKILGYHSTIYIAGDGLKRDFTIAASS